MAISPQGYDYGEAPKSTNPFWGGSAGDAVTNVSMEANSGDYTFKQTKSDDTEVEIGTISTGNLLAEIVDTVSESDGYDLHEIKETENNGTQNDVGKLYLASKQITDLSIDGSNLNVKTVDQNGNVSTNPIALPSGGSGGSGWSGTVTGVWSISPNNDPLSITIENVSDMAVGASRFYRVRAFLDLNPVELIYRVHRYNTGENDFNFFSNYVPLFVTDNNSNQYLAFASLQGSLSVNNNVLTVTISDIGITLPTTIWSDLSNINTPALEFVSATEITFT